MAREAEMGSGGGKMPWRIIGWGMAALLLLLPLVAMQFTAEVNWTGSDFAFAAIVFGIIGVVVELTVRMSRNTAYRAGVGLALAAAFIIVWANAAVGMIGNEEDSYNLFFFGVMGLALLGAVLARFRPAGMALVMAAAGLAQIVAGLVGISIDPHGGVLSAAFGGLWLLSAAFFVKAARDQVSLDR